MRESRLRKEQTPRLDEIRRNAWRMLREGAENASHPFHLGVLATSDESGPDARTVVLRTADEKARRIDCHTDARSPKAAAVRSQATAAWVFYDPAGKVQVRVWGRTRIVAGGETAKKRFESSPLSSRRCYLAPHPPGADSLAPSPNLPETLRDRIPSQAEAEAGFVNFAVVETEVERIDWLKLGARGHLRARFVWNGKGWESTWVYP